MIKSHTVSVVLAVLIASIACTAGLADESSTAPAPAAKVSVAPAAVPAPTLPTVSSRAPGSVPSTSRHSSLAKKVAGVVAGIVVGLPVSAVRQPIHEEKYYIYQTAGKKARPRTTIPYAILCSPFALVSGLIESPFYALNNTLVNYDRPFSKEQFSINDRQEPLTVDPIKGTSER